MSTSPGKEERLRTASQHAEDWFPAVLRISNSIPLGEDDWERAANLLANLQNDFWQNAPILRNNREELLIAAAKANTPVQQFSVLSGELWRCAHLALPAGIELFLRSVLHLFQPLVEYENQVDMSRVVSAVEMKAAERRFVWTVNHWVYLHDPENWGGVLRELLAAERANLQTDADGWSEPFPVVDWQKVWMPKGGISTVKQAIKLLIEKEDAVQNAGERSPVAIRLNVLRERGISVPRRKQSPWL